MLGRKKIFRKLPLTMDFIRGKRLADNRKTSVVYLSERI